MKKIFLALFLTMFSMQAYAATISYEAVSGAHTYYQNEKHVSRAQETHVLTWTFAPAKNYACGNGDWSGCSYQSDGFLYAVDDFDKPWEGVQLGYYHINAYKPFADFTLVAAPYEGKFLVWNITGQDPVKLTWSHMATVTIPDIETPVPAPVPLPAALPLLLMGLGGLGLTAAVKRRKTS